MTVSLWADLERRLSSEASAEHGKWKTERAKYQQGIMDSINDPNIKEVVVISSAQIGKTEILLNIILIIILTLILKIILMWKEYQTM